MRVIKNYSLSGTIYYAVQGSSNCKSVDETLVYDHSNLSYQDQNYSLSGTVYYAEQDGSNC